MTVARGSKHILKMIKEATFGTTPATPTMLEIPITSLSTDVAVGMIRSGQIRNHPFVDRLIQSLNTYDLEFGIELQDDTHDLILELLFGAAWATNSLKLTDALVGASAEIGYTDLAKFDQFTGVCIRRGEFTFNAAEDSAVTASFGAMAKDGTLDAAATLATATTAAPDSDPFVFSEAVVSIGGTEKVVTAASITVERTVDRLLKLGSTTPHEYIPSDVVVTGSITIPLEDAAESTRLTGFTDGELEIACTKGSASRTFTVHSMNYARMGRRIQGRGAILQEIQWEAKYSSADATVMTIARSA